MCCVLTLAALDNAASSANTTVMLVTLGPRAGRPASRFQCGSVGLPPGVAPGITRVDS